MKGIDVLILRAKFGLKQWQLAQMLNVSQTYLCEIEKGKRAVSKNMLEKIRETKQNLEVYKYE